jgi:hypothetical protein
MFGQSSGASRREIAETRHGEERLVRRSSASEGGSDEAIHFPFAEQSMDCFAEPVIGRAFARPVGADPLARNDGAGAAGSGGRFRNKPNAMGLSRGDIK